VATTPATAEETVAGVGPVIPEGVSYELPPQRPPERLQRLYYNQWAPPVPVPNCSVTINTDMYGPTTVLVDERAWFDEQTARSAIAATTQELQNEDSRRRLEREVSRHLEGQVRHMVAELTRSMTHFAQAAMTAAAEMNAFAQVLARTVEQSRRSTGWLGDSDSQIERYEQTAHLDLRAWARTARGWNEYQQEVRRRWLPTGWYGIPMTTSANTNTLYLQNGWNNVDYTTGATAQTYTFAGDYLDYGTAGTGAYQWQQWMTSGTRLTSLDWWPMPSPCTCEGAGTCEHCTETRLARERAAWRELRRKRQRKVAETRGHRLLLSLLDDAQKVDYLATKSFLVTAADGRLFRLRKGKTAELLDAKGEVDASYCIHLFADPSEKDYISFVDEDTTIAQLFMLWHEPHEFDRIANVTPRYRPVLGTAQAQRYLEEHDRETEAILRAEGIADPRQWVEDLRREVRERYRNGTDALIVEQGQVRQAVANAVVEDEIFEVDRLAEAAA